MLLCLNCCLYFISVLTRNFSGQSTMPRCCSFAVISMLKSCGGCGGLSSFPRCLEVLVVDSITLHRVLLQTVSSFLLHATGNKWVCFALLDNELMCWKMLPIPVFPNGLKSSLNLLAWWNCQWAPSHHVKCSLVSLLESWAAAGWNREPGSEGLVPQAGAWLKDVLWEGDTMSPWLWKANYCGAVQC